MSRRFVVAWLVAILLVNGMTRVARAQSSYPSVNEVAQKERDAGRRLILETELMAERGELARTKALGFNSDPEREREVHRHVENIKALQRELEGVARESRESRTARRSIVKAIRQTATSADTSPRFWDPYNRAAETTDFSTTP